MLGGFCFCVYVRAGEKRERQIVKFEMKKLTCFSFVLIIDFNNEFIVRIILAVERGHMSSVLVDVQTIKPCVKQWAKWYIFSRM